MKKLSLIAQIVLAVIVGVVFGLAFPTLPSYFSIVGKIFLRLMQMSIPVLILGQIIHALGSINRKEVSRIGGRTVAIFAISTLIAAFWGILFGQFFKPGQGVEINLVGQKVIEARELSFTETFTEFFPSNIFSALSSGTIIQIIIFALIFGLALNRFMEKKPSSPILSMIEDLNDIIMNVIRMVMTLAPLGVFSLVADTASSAGASVILPLIKYLLIYSMATAIFLGLWILVVSLYCRKSPRFIMAGVKNMSIVALTTVSSAVTLPIAMEGSKKDLGIGDRVTNLVLPLGVSLNSNGAAMHMAITVVTAAQLYGLEMSLERLVYLGILASLVSLANAVVPGASIVSLAIIFPQMGVPLEAVALFAGVDYFVGMIRTILNVDSDVFTAMLVAKSVNDLA